MKHNLKVINLWGGPGCGKSTTAAGLFHKMKVAGYDVEIITEYAKEMVWERQHPDQFTNQIYISSKQHNRQLNLVAHGVEYCITDSPVLMSALYAPDDYYKHFLPLLLEVHDSYDNYNFFLKREFDYVEKGRNKTAEQSDELSMNIECFLTLHDVKYTKIQSTFNCSDVIFDIINKGYK